jgi:putative NADH-flavin reductase
MKVLVWVQRGGPGGLIVRDALAKGHSVVVLVRSKARALRSCKSMHTMRLSSHR